jgi:hypothetical protein
LSSEPGGCRAFLCKALPCGFSPRQNCRQACPLVVVIVSLRSARVCPLAVAVTVTVTGGVVRDRGLRSPVALFAPSGVAVVVADLARVPFASARGRDPLRGP